MIITRDVKLKVIKREEVTGTNFGTETSDLC